MDLSFNTIIKLTGLSSATTIKEYLESSYLVFLISRYSQSLKKQTYFSKKAYFIDTGMANIVGFRVAEEKGRMLENTVFLQLKRKREEIYFHKNKRKCDFLIKK